MNYMKKFRDFLEDKGVGINTVDNYINYVKKYIGWYEDFFNEKCSVLRKEDIDAYVQQLSCEKSSAVIRVNLSGLKRYNEFLVARGIQDEIVVGKIQAGCIPNLNEGEKSKEIPSEAIIEQFRMYVCSKDSIRNYAIVTILAYGGLKLTECIELKVSDIDFENRTIRVGSGNKRVIPMDSKVEASLKLYFSEREYEDCQCNYLFVSKSDKKLDRTLINKIFYKYRKDFNITTNTLRSFYCSRLRNQGYSKQEISAYAGYKPENEFVDKLLRRTWR